jgi:hypothetical protein
MAGDRVGWDQIKQGYKMYKDCPYYALFEGTSTGRRSPGRLLFCYKGGDRDGEGWTMLEQNLQVAEETTPESLFVLQFYDRLGKNDSIDPVTPYAGSFPLRMRERPAFTPAINGVKQFQDTGFLAYLQAQLLEKDVKIRELEDEVLDLQQENDNLVRGNEPKTQISGIVGQIGEAGNQFPWLADIIKDWSTVLKHKFGAGGRGSVAVSGVPGAGTQQAPADTSALPWNKRYEAARKVLMEWYARIYGDLETQEGREKGCQQFASDMESLAKITADDDYMMLALKKLRQTAADF